MTTITLDAIKAEQSRIADLIAQFETQAKTRTITFPAVEIELKDSEHYAGIIIGDESEFSYHQILLPGEAECVNWEDAKSWAASIGGELPDRREQALLYANLKGQFQPAWYWSREQHAGDSRYAWSQGFGGGSQGGSITYDELRARAVRKLIIR